VQQKELERAQREKQKAVKQIGFTLMSTVGREVGHQVEKNFDSFGQQLGGNVGASIA
jgi:hypothetical protein